MTCAVTFLLQHRYLAKRPIEQVTVSYLEEAMTRAYLEEHLDLDGVDVVCLGDMHVPFVDTHQNRLAVHPGGVGAPMGDVRDRAQYAVVEIDADEVRVYCCDAAFSREEAVREMDAATTTAGGPGSLGLRKILFSEPPYEYKGWNWKPAITPLRVPRQPL